MSAREEERDVVWRIQAPSHMAPRQAAEWALSVIRDPFTDALSFEVDGVEVDLNESQDEEV